ncbi:hypothetical protein J4461_02135 [Candidatus Pacearchaeota archaeon]|nr:hypothetical protein [Candidatus Pacearchaeota archaeon]
MVKRGLVALAFISALVFLSSNALSLDNTVEGEIQKIVHYAEEYEIGNINFVELLVYASASRQRLTEILGVVSREEGGLFKEEQIRNVLGSPSEEMKWAWSDKEQKEKKLDRPVPVWEKIIFDGNKIQIRLNAWPSIFTRGEKEEVIYRLNFDIDFKRPKDELNIKDKFSSIKSLAESFIADPSSSNGEALAKESVNVEKLFNSYYRQNGGKCEEIMGEIFGSENKRKDEKILSYEIDFYEGDNFAMIGRLEMCEDCQWSWINLEFWTQGRGPGFRESEESSFSGEIEKNLDDSYYKERIITLISQMKTNLEAGDYKSALSARNEIREVNNAWNEKSNNIRESTDNLFNNKEGEKQEEYGWIKREQERRKYEKELKANNYELRKEFYLNLFKDYEKKEFYFEQKEYEHRLLEQIREAGNEICDNNQDDNKDSQIDCSDLQCGGQVCGKQKVTREDGNNTIEEEIALYCIAGSCQAKEVLEQRQAVCGNHICEFGEQESCSQDCSTCPDYDAIECSGRVIFSGQNASGCPLPPICVQEVSSCNATSDCQQPLCGIAECIESTCKVTELQECRESECSEGEEQYLSCSSGERVVNAVCDSGIWKQLNAICTEGSTSSGNESTINDDVLGDQCITKEDCGNANDVCSNGICVAIPEAVQENTEITPSESEEPSNEQSEPAGSEEQLQEDTSPPSENEEQESPESAEDRVNEAPAPESSSTEQTEVTAGVIMNFLRFTFAKLTLTGFDIEESSSEEPSGTSSEPPQESSSSDSPSSETSDSGTSSESQEESQSQPSTDNSEQNQDTSNTQQNEEQPRREDSPEREEDRQRRDDEDRERRESEERERRDSQCSEDCTRTCKDAKIRPCAEKCIWESCGEDLECNIDEVKQSCESTCQSKEDLNACVKSCSDNCIKGKDFGVSFERNKQEFKEEVGVFRVGGMCRKSPTKTEAFIFFDGWGKNFEGWQRLKQKYYQGGQGEWCKNELENLQKQRQEFEKSFNQEFVTWFFEKYLANSADEWEQHISGIFELYWHDVEISRETAYQMNCLNLDTLPQYNLINVKYETEYGSLEFWEEIKTVRMPGLDKEVQALTPYMKTWVFPPREFIINEMKKSMKEHKFPGPSEDAAERENEGGPTEEEKMMIKQDKKFIEKINKITSKYGGNIDAVVQFKDMEKDEVVFNLYVQVNEEDILKMEPMLPSEVPQEDIRIEIDFNKMYDFIYSMEKEMQGERIESPPWDRTPRPTQRVKEVANGIQAWLKIKSIMNSANYYPKESESDSKALFNEFFSMMQNGGERGEHRDENKDKNAQESEGGWDSKEKITGEIISSLDL